MEIILNKQMCRSLTGRITPMKMWYIQRIHGRFFAVCRNNNKAFRKTTLPAFYEALRSFQEAGFIQEIILKPEEKEALL